MPVLGRVRRQRLQRQSLDALCRRRAGRVDDGQQRLWKIFEKDGFHKVNDKPFHFSDHEYAAFVCELAVGDDCPTVHTDPMVLNRPEDQLDKSGILEKSMDRGASNPHGDWTEKRA